MCPLTIICKLMKKKTVKSFSRDQHTAHISTVYTYGWECHRISLLIKIPLCGHIAYFRMHGYAFMKQYICRHTRTFFVIIYAVGLRGQHRSTLPITLSCCNFMHFLSTSFCAYLLITKDCYYYTTTFEVIPESAPVRARRCLTCIPRWFMCQLITPSSTDTQQVPSYRSRCYD